MNKQKLKDTLQKSFPNQEIKYSGNSKAFFINDNQFNHPKSLEQMRKEVKKESKTRRGIRIISEKLGLPELAEDFKKEIKKEKEENAQFAIQQLNAALLEVLANPTSAPEVTEKYKQIFLEKAKSEGIEMVEDMSEIVVTHVEDKIKESKGGLCGFMKRVLYKKEK